MVFERQKVTMMMLMKAGAVWRGVSAGARAARAVVVSGKRVAAPLPRFFSSSAAARGGDENASGSASAAVEVEVEEDKKKTHSFQAETTKLLDIVAKSLYSEREVFVRELISNAADALEKLRYMQTTTEAIDQPDQPLEIKITADEEAGTFTIEVSMVLSEGRG